MLVREIGPLARDRADQAATAQFLTWMYSPEAAPLLAPYHVPVTAGGPAQTAYWATATHGGSSVGDWRHFRDFLDGAPAIPPPTTVPSALAAVLGGSSSLQQALSDAQQRLNAQITPGTTVSL